MAGEPELFFADNFVRLTKRTPYPWQKKLFLRFIAPTTQPWPEVVDLPTGSGKTSVLNIWLLALAWSIRTGTFGVPRRLAWIVNRRVVVDQVTTELQCLLKRISDQTSECAEIRDLLVSLSLTETPLAASTLRGQLADKGDWSRDPSTPAVIVGTVDMVGSRLLFRGYQAGPYHRPIQAGLLGVDTLIVNDEAHLSPALARLLTSVRDSKPAERITGKCFRILLLSATPGSAEGLQPFGHDPAEDALESKDFRNIFHAPKLLTLHEVVNLNEFDAAIWSLATKSAASRTAIFVEQPEKAAKLAERFRKEKKPCALLTGTMRGFERDRLFENEIFNRFLSREPGTEPVWLVCTSAGEVGINFSCERMVTGLESADHLLQRFGRLNRFGDPNAGEAHVVFRNPAEKETRLRGTLVYLRGLDGDISCSKIWNNRPPAEASSELPIFARLESRHLELWAQTTYKDRFVPPVASWLHGKQESEAPDAEVAWRSDVDILTDWKIDEEQIRDVLDYYPVQVHEKLSEPASRVAAKLLEIAERIGPADALKAKLILVASDGTPSICDLASLAKTTEKNPDYLGYKLLLLPERLGSVHAGMFRSGAPDEPSEIADVADPGRMDDPAPARIRFLFREGEAPVRLRTKEAVSDIVPPASPGRLDLEQYASDRYRPAFVIQHPENEGSFLVYFAARATRKGGQPAEVLLRDHQKRVAAKAKAMASLIGLPELAVTYEAAGNVHDSGKNRPVWQYAMGGNMESPLAKTKAPVNLRLIDGYRHELGSLLDVLSAANGVADDLLLHLVASHHAGARPFFKTRQYDGQNLKRSAGESIEAARRYARLQSQYGAWGLAYLEAIFKCADGLVSAAEGELASA